MVLHWGDIDGDGKIDIAYSSFFVDTGGYNVHYYFGVLKNTSVSGVISFGIIYTSNYFNATGGVDNMNKILQAQTQKDASNPTLSVGGLPTGGISSSCTNY